MLFGLLPQMFGKILLHMFELQPQYGRKYVNAIVVKLPPISYKTTTLQNSSQTTTKILMANLSLRGDLGLETKQTLTEKVWQPHSSIIVIRAIMWAIVSSDISIFFVKLGR